MIEEYPNSVLPSRQFKGVWICAALWTHPDLNPTEKCLIAEIDSLCGKGHACFAGNDHLAKHLHVSPAHMRDMLANLTNLGHIVRLAFTGRQTLRCVNPEISSDPRSSKDLIKKYKVTENRYRKNPIADIGQTLPQISEKSDTENTSRVTTERTTTKTSAPSQATNGNRAAHPVIVALSSFATEDERDFFDAVTEKFALTKKQSEHIKKFPIEFVRQQVEIVLSKPRTNLAASLMTAINEPGGWKAPRSTVQPKRARARAFVQEEFVELSDQERATNVAHLKEARQKIKESA